MQDILCFEQGHINWNNSFDLDAYCPVESVRAANAIAKATIESSFSNKEIYSVKKQIVNEMPYWIITEKRSICSSVPMTYILRVVTKRVCSLKMVKSTVAEIQKKEQEDNPAVNLVVTKSIVK